MTTIEFKAAPAVSIVMAYYENPQMLTRHIQTWFSYRPEDAARVGFIVIDDGSPRNPAKKVLYGMSAGFNIRLFRIVPNIPWNQDGARNLGMKHCMSDWAFMTDMDHVVEPDQIGKLLNFAQIEARRGEYYMPAAQLKTDGTVLGEHPNSYLFNVQDYWRIGGYDEDFAGAYGSDGNFRKNAQGLGLKEIKTSAWHTRVYRKEDIFDACTHDFSRKDGPYYRGNFPRLEAKRRGPAYRAGPPLRFEYVEESI
jgi:glycosyltransferase involved in cell wall biosynthesis